MTFLYPVLKILFGLASLATAGWSVVHALRAGNLFGSQDPRQSRAESPVTFWISLVLISFGLGRAGVRLIQTELSKLPAP